MPAIWKIYKNWTKYLLWNIFIITENDVTVEKDNSAKWVAPYNTSYYYTNITINESSGISRIEWATYVFVISTSLVVASANRNVRIRIWTNWDWKPLMWSSSSIVAWSSYFVKTRTDLWVYKTVHQPNWALHLNNDTSYSAMSVAEWKTWTATSARTVRADYLKQIIEYYIQQNWILKSDTWTQTVTSTNTSQTTPFWVKSNKSWSVYISFSDSSGWKWSYWVDWSGNPVYYNGTSHQLAYKTDIPDVSWKQDTLVSWENIKTVNGQSLLWSGNIQLDEWWFENISNMVYNSDDLLVSFTGDWKNYTLTYDEDWAIHTINDWTNTWTITYNQDWNLSGITKS